MCARRLIEEPFETVVLVVAPGVVLGTHLRVAERDLPHHDALLGEGAEAAEEANVAVEVRGIPPRRAAIAIDRLLETRVAITEFCEGDIEVGAERGIKGGRPGAKGIDRGIGRVAVLDVVAGAPDADRVAELHVRGIAVAQANHGLGEPADRVGEPGEVGKAGGCYLRGHSCGVIARGTLLHVAPHVGFHVEDGLPARRGRLLEEELEVLPVGDHRRGVLEVVVDALHLSLVDARGGLVDLIVGEDGSDPGRRRLLHVVGDELRVGVPIRPAVAGVHAAGEVLITESVGGVGPHRGSAIRLIGEADLKG